MYLYCFSENIVAQTAHFLSSWLMGHILIRENKYAEYFNNKGVT
tara:strand:+ start:11073 stop:11204 length:132 start_codon:yes stop_codon:yes gene_type:complete